jgi:drug/metabolite transporter (DMT)-like permease
MTAKALDPTRRLPSWLLYVTAVAIWSTTWYAIVHQVAHTTPAVGVTVRFALAGCIALGIAAWRGDRRRCTAREHRLLAFQGAFMYSIAYLAVYHAERLVPSGLVAVGYSASPLLSGIGAWLLWRTPIGPRFLLGGAACIAGVGLIFAPELARVGTGGSALHGAAFTVAAVGLSCVGSLAASRNARHGIPFWAAMGWGMLYGAALSCAVVIVTGIAGATGIATGQTFAWPSAPAWWLSLAYLALAGSVVAFACFLELQTRVGPGPASTIGVMTPVLALVVSTLFEGFTPVWMTWAGAALAVAGNLLILRPGRRGGVATKGSRAPE